MSRKLLSLLISAVILSVLAFFLIKALIHKSFVPSLRENVVNREFDWKVPELPSGFTWKEESPNEEQLSRYSIVYDDRYLSPDKKIDSVNSSSQYRRSVIKVSGKIFKTEINDIDPNYSKAGADLYESYVKPILLENGWFLGRKYDSYFISGASESFKGSNNSYDYFGYVKINGYYLRTYVFYFETKTSGNNFSVEKCPCVTKMEIFISDPVYIRNFITDID